ncbi:UDP-N-acetylmuramoyl-tripeptide--D-alanyl-D-alanine ligase [Candidatus Kaiserbacteria bacterium]|nr:UDP-N-acetylmuramoyl-tripeptide--D-alanyl-D-alanine ligase [Candidatus Kaiserbacteria bacterium]USN88802.1 MAG: UDP-N-acetylmuramoyl-tripeptide--D-alanyl-D-alanine ligase [Candidatus Nomurabacteria bacterium]
MKQLFKNFIVRILIIEASILLRRHKPRIVAITGSVGKTSTKDAVYAAIKNNVFARKSEKSFNSDIGVPLTVLGLPNAWSNPFFWLRNIVEGFFIALFSRSYPEVLVLEAGIDRPGDMKHLTAWLKPDIVVLTKFSSVPVHVEYFSSPEAVIDEKLLLASAMKPDGLVVYNNDDTLITDRLPDLLQRKVGFGRYLETDFTARTDRVVYHDDRPVGVAFSLEHFGNSYKVQLEGTIGTQHVYACTAAIAVADELSVPIEAATISLGALRTPNGRMRLIPGLKATMLIDDTYNSSPIAAEQALQTLSELSYAGRKIAVLGDMLELGKFSSEAHRSLGAKVAESADILFTVGVRAHGIADGALAAGMTEKHIFQYDDINRAGRELQSLLAPGDVVLVKASQGVRAERIVEEVMADPARAEELLVRQDRSWKKIA